MQPTWLPTATLILEKISAQLQAGTLTPETLAEAHKVLTASSAEALSPLSSLLSRIVRSGLEEYIGGDHGGSAAGRPSRFEQLVVLRALTQLVEDPDRYLPVGKLPRWPMLQIVAGDQHVELEITDAVEDDLPVRGFRCFFSVLRNPWIGANAGAALGSLLMPGVGTVIGGITGWLIGTMGKRNARKVDPATDPATEPVREEQSQMPAPSPGLWRALLYEPGTNPPSAPPSGPAGDTDFAGLMADSSPVPQVAELLAASATLQALTEAMRRRTIGDPVPFFLYAQRALEGELRERLQQRVREVGLCEVGKPTLGTYLKYLRMPGEGERYLGQHRDPFCREFGRFVALRNRVIHDEYDPSPDEVDEAWAFLTGPVGLPLIASMPAA